MAPWFMFTELRAITAIIGRPPIKPDRIVLNPIAVTSLFRFVFLFSGSMLSIAFAEPSVSMVETKKTEMTTNQKLRFPILLKFGNVKISEIFKLEGSGK